MSTITGIAHVGIRVAELARSRTFYEALGFEFVMGPVGPEPVAIMRHPSGVEVNFILNAAARAEPVNVLMDGEEKHAGITHVALLVDDLGGWLETLEAAGIPLSGGPVEFPNGGRAVFVRDPDRNVLELHQAAPR